MIRYKPIPRLCENKTVENKRKSPRKRLTMESLYDLISNVLIPSIKARRAEPGSCPMGIPQETKIPKKINKLRQKRTIREGQGQLRPITSTL